MPKPFEDVLKGMSLSLKFQEVLDNYTPEQIAAEFKKQDANVKQRAANQKAHDRWRRQWGSKFKDE